MIATSREEARCGNGDWQPSAGHFTLVVSHCLPRRDRLALLPMLYRGRIPKGRDMATVYEEPKMANVGWRTFTVCRQQRRQSIGCWPRPNASLHRRHLRYE